jgi:formate dehydrogenase major subunit
MKLTRRGFMKWTGAGAAALSLSRLGFDLKPVAAYAADLKIAGAKEVVSICPFCSCGCNIIMYIKDGKFISSEETRTIPGAKGPWVPRARPSIPCT